MSENAASRTSVHSIVRRPGPGWRFVGCSTWQHDSGVRVHYLGMALMPDGTVRREHETQLAEGYIRLAGGNRKRGLMMWALALHRIQEQSRRLAELFTSQSVILAHTFQRAAALGRGTRVRVRRTLPISGPWGWSLHCQKTLSTAPLHWIVMPVFLEPPQHDPRGVDGQGHNRMALLGTMYDECALRPTSEATFWDSHDTRKARYGNYGPCTNGGRCESCKRYRKTTPWQWGGDELVVRVDDDGYPWIMNRPDDGWGEFGMRVTWEYLLRVEAEFSRGRDQHGPTIVMRKSA